MATSSEEVASQHASRSANERFRVVLERRPAGDGLVPFLCECADDDCLGRIEMTLADYAATHSDRAQYVVLHGHRTTDSEDLVDPRGPFDIFKKH